MMNSLFRVVKRVAHACSDFGTYYMTMQRRCLKSGVASDCDGMPSAQEAQRDYRAAMKTHRGLPI